MNNYNNRNQGGYNGRSYGNRNYNGGGGGNRQHFKKSGASWQTTKDGVRYLIAWKKKGREMVSLTAFPPSAEGDKHNGRKIRGVSNTGREWERWLVKIKVGDYSKEQLYYGFYYPDKQHLIINELGMIVNPNANGGHTRSGKFVKGYFGSIKIRR